MKELNPKQERFCREYLIDHNATQAAIRAGYSPKTARFQACDLLTKPHIEAFLEGLQKTQNKRLDLKADDVLLELLKIAKVDLAKCYGEDGRLLPIHQIPEETRMALSGLEIDELWEQGEDGKEQTGVTRKLKLWDKVKSLELLGKHLKLWSDKAEVNVTVDLGAIIDAAKGKA